MNINVSPWKYTGVHESDNGMVPCHGVVTDLVPDEAVHLDALRKRILDNVLRDSVRVEQVGVAGALSVSHAHNKRASLYIEDELYSTDKNNYQSINKNYV